MAGGIFPDSMFPVWLFTGFVFPQQTKLRILRREQESFVTGIRECPSKRFLHSLLSAIQREISSYSIYGKKYKKENGKVHCLTDISISNVQFDGNKQEIFIAVPFMTWPAGLEAMSLYCFCRTPWI
ncbi:MAG: hypothetical protein ACLTVN_09430 [Blautia hansenii]|jgi:hypothetical protein|uniref:Uncharacterized protein n=1 Tax=Blautia hansenii TaxID=1322 RepID=A0ABX2I6F1_BLAHA|nr:hypothetical protein [Blautia hansenii]MCB5600320.1 hypothetical protein [Blautia hansenii]NSJ85889.1 hypothetical protein [Blautia hansenii]